MCICQEKGVELMTEILKKARKKKKLTQREAASMLNVSQQTYSKVELGVYRPSVRLAKEISKILEIDWTIFYRDL